MAQPISLLPSFLTWANLQAWRPGDMDCCMCLASWAIWLGHPDPAIDLRGTYKDEAGFQAIVAKAGGVVPVVSGCVDHIGGKRIDAPVQGAIGVVGSQFVIDRQWGAIFDGYNWLVRAKSGFVAITAASLAIWEI